VSASNTRRSRLRRASSRLSISVEGRWKLLILFHLFGGKVMRFSDLERAISAISQKMLAQQLRRLEADGIVQRTVHNQVPPKVDYRLTEWDKRCARRSTPC